ncbi:hypothetical protein [Breznakiella homolactica]|uniref:Uncharacterized protein n=1 Tax=Breznakiella homolactica TaxID=2798577 RepID=A0A7T7XKR4_9SPIR|nr:hypothetical protein [Breznakiella homolactica]QQO08048.1 hypothetical protein JFL75_14000 [Breznakiella homolactica]
MIKAGTRNASSGISRIGLAGFISAIFIVLFSLSAHAQENREDAAEELLFDLLEQPITETPLPVPAAAIPDSSIPEEEMVFRIRSIEFDVDGSTREFALMNAGEFEIGERINGKSRMDRYVSNKTQLLVNERVFDSVEISYTVDQADENNEFPVDLLVAVEDTWNLLILPWPEYDSNSGFELTIKARDYNFLGTMNPLKINLGYQIDSEYMDDFSFKKGAIFLEIDSDTPFRLWGFNWNLDFDNTFSYTYDEPFYYKNRTGVSMELPVKKTLLTFGAYQSFLLNEENDDDDKAEYGEYFENGWYMASELETSWKIPTTLEVGPYGGLFYTPKINFTIKYKPGDSVDEPRKGPTLTFSHELWFEKIDWIGNYRRGLDAAIENSNEYNFHSSDWDKSFAVDGIVHHPFAEFFGLSGRLRYKHWFDDPYDEAGDVIRGVRNDDLYADYMLSLNIDPEFRLFRFLPSQWFNNRKLRVIDFEFHLTPFLDIALVKDPKSGRDFSFKDPVIGGGIEVIVYPYFMRSAYLRVSLGFDLNRAWEIKSIPGGKYREIFLGLGHHY